MSTTVADSNSRPSAAKPGRSRRQRTRRIVAGTALVAIAGSSMGYGLGRLEKGPSTSSATTTAAVHSTPDSIPSMRSLIDSVLPSVVSVRAEGPQGVRQGSGVVVSSDNEVLTNAHVLAGATKVTVTKYGSTKPVTARIVGTSTANDLALVRLDGTRLPVAQIGISRETQLGDPVVAVGNALGLAAGTPTVTTGIVSAEGRSITTASGATMTGLIQTDAAINPGNSGGPLFNSAGRVIGINTAVAGSAGVPAQNIGFAIPSDRAWALLPALRTGGPADTPKAELGVSTVTLTESLRAAYGFTPKAGAVVTAVKPESPAAAELRAGDVIVRVDGTTVNSTNDLRTAVDHHHPGDIAILRVVRGAASDWATVSLMAPNFSVTTG
jgi:serine protease Do